MSAPLFNGVDPFISIVTGGASLYRSNNNAVSFEPTPIANGAALEDPVNPHQDMQVVVTDPSSPNTERGALVATDGGIYHTDGSLPCLHLSTAV